MGMISQHHDSAGWAAVLVVAFAISCAMVLRWLRADLRAHDRRCRDVLWHPPHRLMAGTSLIFAGALVRLAAGFPARAMIEARQWAWFHWWGDASAWIVNAGAILIVAGLVTMMWPALHGRFGRATLPVVMGGASAVYAAGVAAVILAARWFQAAA
jgi:hypothetical protein